jgi:hypothetical protein
MLRKQKIKRKRVVRDIKASVTQPVHNQLQNKSFAGTDKACDIIFNIYLLIRHGYPFLQAKNTASYEYIPGE